MVLCSSIGMLLKNPSESALIHNWCVHSLLHSSSAETPTVKQPAPFLSPWLHPPILLRPEILLPHCPPSPAGPFPPPLAAPSPVSYSPEAPHPALLRTPP